MKRGGCGYQLQVPWRQHDDPILSSTPFEQLEGRKLRLVIALVGFSIAILIFVWNSRQVVCRSDLPPRTLPGLVFPLYSHNYIQSSNGSQDEPWHQSSGANGRGRRTLSHPIFELKSERIHGRERFYIEMKLGIHAKLFNFIIDTGSGTTWVYCKLPGHNANIRNLGPHGYFVPRKKASIKCNRKDKRLCHKYQGNHGQGIPCNGHHKYECLAWISYADGSMYKGAYIQESFTLPTWDKTEVKGQGVLGCINEETETSGGEHIPLFRDGLIGLGTCKGTITSEWMKSKLITNRRIGICIGQAKSRQLLLSRNDVGYVTVGVNLQEKFSVNQFGWAKLANTEGFDCANIATLSYIIFEGKTYYPPTTSGLPLVLDTGSELTRLDHWFYRDICAKLDSLAMDKGYTSTRSDVKFVESYRRQCWTAPKDTTTSPLDNFPILTFCIKGIPNSIHLDPVQCLMVQPKNYLEWKEDELLLCLNILESVQEEEYDYLSNEDFIELNNNAPPGESILGVAQMRGHLIEIDPDNYRVRWKPDFCDF